MKTCLLPCVDIADPAACLEEVYKNSFVTHTNKWIFQPTLWRTARGHSQWHCYDENGGTCVHRDIHNAMGKKIRSVDRKNVNIKIEYTSMLRSKGISYHNNDLRPAMSVLYRVIHKSLQDLRPCSTVAGMVTPKRSMSTEGETLQVSVLPYRCSICPPLVAWQMSFL